MENKPTNEIKLTKEQKRRNLTEWYDGVPGNVKKFNPNSEFMQLVRKLGREIGLPDRTSKK